MIPFLTQLAARIREGHATNSSSSHSILLLQKKEDAATVGTWEEWTPSNEFSLYASFGWQDFKCTTPGTKLTYLVAILCEQLKGGFPDWFAQDEQAFRKRLTQEALDILGITEADIVVPLETEFMVDHDSIWSFPVEESPWHQKTIHKEFARWYKNFILREDVVVYGGNDNQETPDMPQGEKLPLGGPGGAGFFVREVKDVWVLYSPGSGYKLHVPKNSPGIDLPNLPLVPMITSNVLHKDATFRSIELLDIKITDYCNIGCAYCYQGSTAKGKHTLMSVNEIITLVQELRPFEVALGGGEPTDYPQLEALVRSLNMYKVRVAITTRRPEAIPLYLWDKISGMGISIDSAEELNVLVRKFVLAHDRMETQKTMMSLLEQKWVIQLVVGAMPQEELHSILDLCKKRNLRVLLLGYKTTFRGANVNPKPFSATALAQFLRSNFVSKNGEWNSSPLSVDTAFFQAHLEELLEVIPEIDLRSLAPLEGETSFYLDLVARNYAASSYAGKKYPFPTQYGDRVDAKQVSQTFMRGLA